MKWKILAIASVMRVWNKPDNYTLLVGTQNGTATVERSVAVSEEANTHWPYSSGILLFGICSWEIKHNVYTETSISMFMAAAFINSKYGKQQISMNWWIDKQHFIHPYSVILFSSKKKELMVFMTTWLNLKTSCQLKKSEAKGYITLHLQKGKMLPFWKVLEKLTVEKP